MAEARVVVCHPVEEARGIMERFAFMERRCMEVLAAWVWTTGELGTKLTFGAHAYEDAMQSEVFRDRGGELRPSLPTYGWDGRPPGFAQLDAIFRELADAPTLAAKLGGLYGALKPWLVTAYDDYLATADPILEAPTVRLLEQALRDERRQVAWGRARLDDLKRMQPDADAERWRRRVRHLLNEAVTAPTSDAAARAPLADFTGTQPAVDPRFDLIYYTPGVGSSREFEIDPPNETEVRKVMLSTLTAVETEAAELLCRILVEFPELPWEMRRRLARQMWDECRHAASQWRLLEEIGGYLGCYPSIVYINPFAGDEPDVFKRLIVLQRVVEGSSVDQHRPRGRYFLDQGAIPLVQMFDYILADEDGHIALSRWTNELVGADQAHLDELSRYQARKEQEFAEYSDWIVSKRRDLQRLFQPAAAGSARA